MSLLYCKIQSRDSLGCQSSVELREVYLQTRLLVLWFIDRNNDPVASSHWLMATCKRIGGRLIIQILFLMRMFVNRTSALCVLLALCYLVSKHPPPPSSTFWGFCSSANLFEDWNSISPTKSLQKIRCESRRISKTNDTEKEFSYSADVTKSSRCCLGTRELT